MVILSAWTISLDIKQNVTISSYLPRTGLAVAVVI